MSYFQHTFLVPAYYRRFSCKGTGCRATCCTGLDIQITQDDYFRLLGIDCSESLRQDLDTALHILPHPDLYRYACISPDFTGRCRMLTEDGLCRLQKECGADVLTRVCRYYPRSPRILHEGSSPAGSGTGDIFALFCANSCEKTIELLEAPDALVMDHMELSFDLDLEPDDKPLTPLIRRMRSDVPFLLQSSGTIPERLHRVCSVLHGSSVSWDNTSVCRSLRMLDEIVSERYGLLRSYTDQTIQVFAHQPDPAAFLCLTMRHLHLSHPQLNDWMGRILSNDILYLGRREWRSFTETECAQILQYETIMLTLLLCGVSASSEKGSDRDGLTDIFSSFYRMADLTPYWRNLMTLLRRDEFSDTQPA